ncbi:uncharacterized protein LOC111828700 [Capsella rubella]|uniref:uncharacterized protein LOC111828700 n=1 Tax=Capsella rubella TaxID=81985 RepID=UPI000CD50955|nr:uncharacterized protein LOC111828700 [Capsella rubella]
MNGEYIEAMEAGRGRPPHLQLQYMRVVKCLAYCMSFTGFFMLAFLCVAFLKEHWITCAIFGVWNIAYLGAIIRIRWEDKAPAQAYRLGAEGRFRIFVAMMIYMFCVLYSNQDLATTRGPWVLIYGFYPIGPMGLIVSVCWPIEDVTPIHIYWTIMTGVAYGFLVGIELSLSGFCLSLGFFLIHLFIEIWASVRENEPATVLLVNTNNEVI